MMPFQKLAWTRLCCFRLCVIVTNTVECSLNLIYTLFLNIESLQQQLKALKHWKLTLKALRAQRARPWLRNFPKPQRVTLEVQGFQIRQKPWFWVLVVSMVALSQQLTCSFINIFLVTVVKVQNNYCNLIFSLYSVNVIILVPLSREQFH